MATTRTPRADRGARLLASAVLGSCLATLATDAGAQPIAPFAEPPFASACTVHRFGEGEPPPLEGIPDDPLCVEYEKRDITASNGGAVRFLAVEPSRFAAAIPKCRYWQQDHWSVQLAPGTPALVRWDGSYWFDKGSGVAAGRLRNFSIAGEPASAEQAATLVEPVDAGLAALIRGFGDGSNGGGGASVCLGSPVPGCPTGDAAARRCGDGAGDPCAVAAARAAAAERCGCASSASNAAHVRCVAAAADEEMAAGRLPARCRRAVVDCARRSTCGRPGGAVTCCRTLASGRSSCRVERSAEACRAPRGGSACVGARGSCCDACTPTACP